MKAEGIPVGQENYASHRCDRSSLKRISCILPFMLLLVILNLITSQKNSFSYLYRCSQLGNTKPLFVSTPIHFNSATNTATLSNDKITIVIAHCHEDITWLDLYESCDRIDSIHVMSKCGQESITLPTKVASCLTIHRIRNCGVEEYAYMQFIERNYDTLPPYIAFVTAGALPENPHIIHDSMTFFTGTTYKDLTRHVRPAWQMGKPTLDGDHVIINRTIPEYWDQGTWTAAWRSHFLVARKQIHLYNRDVYTMISNMLCSKKCYFENCNFEGLYNFFFRCTNVYYSSDSGCTDGVVHATPNVEYSDFRKDSVHSMDQKQTAIKSNVRTCGNKTIIVAESELNGLLMCIDHEYDRSNTTSWESSLLQLFAEKDHPVVTDINWAYNASHSFTLSRQSSWIDREENDKKADEVTN